MWLLLGIGFISASQDVLAAVGDKLKAGEVIPLNEDNLMDNLKQSDCPWAVLAYSGNASFSQKALENFKKASEQLGVIYKVGSCNMEENPKLAGMFTVLKEDDASLFIFGQDRTNPRVIQQAGRMWKVDHFVKEGLRCIGDLVDVRVEDYKTDRLKSSYSVVFNAENFNTTLADLYIKDVYSPWLLLFHDEDDKESQVVRKTFAKASNLLFPKVRTATIDIDKNRALAAHFFDTLYVPTIMYLGHDLHRAAYANPILPMPVKPSVAHIINFALSERLVDIATIGNNGKSPVMISVGDVPYYKARLLQFDKNTTLHVFSQV